EGRWWQVQEYFVHRSIYHHKEADPYVWAIPRLRGQAKASLVAVEFDEYGGGHGDRVHARLYADLMAGAGLDDGYLHYLEHVPAPMLAIVNMMSLFGLHRELRGALVGHFADVEITSPPGSR
ncbi:iron-containing redox enzyme family protein, partial [Nocardia puris]